MYTRICLCMLICMADVRGQINIPDGTKLRVRLDHMLSSATAEQGQTVELEVADTIQINGVAVIPEGARVTGTVTEAEAKRRLGRAGKLDFSIDRVRAADGDWIPLRYSLEKKHGDSNAVKTGIITAGVAIVFWPAAPVMLLIKGKDITMNKGMAFDVFTDSTHMMRSNPLMTEDRGTPRSVASGLASITITASVGGADIDVDGAFVGNTPSTLQLPPGLHQIVVRSGNSTWHRAVTVSTGSAVSLAATLAPETSVHAGTQ